MARGVKTVSDKTNQDIPQTRGYVVDPAQALRSILASKAAPAAAKATAARTLAELEGRIGKHQQAPIDRLAESRVSLLSRGELERELARLRASLGTKPAP